MADQLLSPRPPRDGQGFDTLPIGVRNVSEPRRLGFGVQHVDQALDWIGLDLTGGKLCSSSGASHPALAMRSCMNMQRSVQRSRWLTAFARDAVLPCQSIGVIHVMSSLALGPTGLCAVRTVV